MTSFNQGSWTDLIILEHFNTNTFLNISDQICSVKYRDRCVRSWPVYSSMPGVWPTSPPSPRPCLTGSPSTAPTTTTPYRWPFAKEKVAYSPLTSLPPPSSLLHIYTLIKRSSIDESTMYAMFKTSLKKCVNFSHRSWQSVCWSEVFCSNLHYWYNYFSWSFTFWWISNLLIC